MIRNLLLVILVLVIALVMVNVLHKDDNYNLKLEELKHKYALKAVFQSSIVNFRPCKKNLKLLRK